MAKTTPEISEDISGGAETADRRRAVAAWARCSRCSPVLGGPGSPAPRRVLATSSTTPGAGAFLMLRSSLLSAISRPASRVSLPREGGRVRGRLPKPQTAASARTTIPANVAENRRRMAEQMGVRASAPAQRLPDPFARCRGGDRTMARRGAAARRRHRQPAPKVSPIGIHRRRLRGRSCWSTRTRA